MDSKVFDDVRCHLPFTLYQAFKCVLLLPLLPFRLLIFLLMIAVYGGLCSILMTKNPNFGLRWRIANVVGRFGGQAICFVLGLRVKRRGYQEALKAIQSREVSIVVCNHSSHLDPLILIADLMPSFVAVGVNGVHERNSLIANCILMNHGILVNQLKSTGSSMKIAERTFPASQPPQMPPLLIFPEGTTTNGTALLHFQTGAFRAGNPVLIVSMKYPYQYVNPATSFDTGLQKIPHVINLLLQLCNDVEIEYLPVYYPNEAERKDPKLFANNVRTKMAQSLNVQPVDLDYKHKYEYLKHMKNKH